MISTRTFPSDIEYTLSRIGTIADSVDSSMTVGEIVRRAYLCGVGEPTLDEFRKLVEQAEAYRFDSAIDGAIAIDEIGAMVYRDRHVLDASRIRLSTVR